MTDNTDRLTDDDVEEHEATMRLGDDDDHEEEHAATVRLGDDDDHDVDEVPGTEERAALPKPPPPVPKLPPQTKAKPSTDKLKAMLAKSKGLSERPTVLDARDADESTAPSLESLESEADETDEVDAVLDEVDPLSTVPELDISDLTQPNRVYTREEFAAPEPRPSEDETQQLEWTAEKAAEAQALADAQDAAAHAAKSLEERSDPPPTHSGPLAAPPAAYELSEPLVPSGEHGLVPGIGEHSRSGEHALPRPVNRDPRRVVVAMVAIGVFAVVISFVLVVQNWLAPTRAMVWIGAAALASTLLMGLIAPYEHDGGPVRAFMIRVLPGLAFTCVAIIASSIWSIGAVRALAVGFAPDDVLSMERILDDPSDDVAAAGCERYMAHYDDPTWWGRMLTIVAARPAVASTCLRDVSPELQASVSASLVDRWTRDLLSDETPSEGQACAMAVGLTQLPIEPAVMSAPLLDCTLSARDEKTQACCGEALASTVSEPMQWATRLSSAAARIEGKQTPSGVFSMAFQSDALTPPQKKFADAVKFDGVMGRGAALALVCETMDQDQDQVVRHLQAALDGECNLDVAKLPNKLEVWGPICEATKIEVQADRSRPPVDTLCQITREAVMPEAIDTARRLMTLARVRQNEGIADGVHEGYAQMISNFGASGELASSNPMALSAEERHRAMMANSRGAGTVVFFKDKERRKFERNLDPESRKELQAWEKRRAERMRER